METMRLFLCGDVMLGRGVDYIMPHPGNPRIHEEFAKSAVDYVSLAERKHGPIPRPAGYNYIWGDVLADLDRENVAARIVNLETSVTTSEAFASKGINYRMHPKNVSALTTAKIDCCALANNHVLDWGREGLEETLRILQDAGIRFAGAGMTLSEATAPALIPLHDGQRIVFFSFALSSSGIPASWAAEEEFAGVNLLQDWSDASLEAIMKRVATSSKPSDIRIASLHWGGNWGYLIPLEEQIIAHRLIDICGFHVVHGHSSHHPKAIEVYRGHLILYGCGDFITDYEGISGHEEFRSDLSVAYIPSLSTGGELTGMKMLVYRLRKFRAEAAPAEDAHWLEERLNRESAKFDIRVNVSGMNTLSIQTGAFKAD